MNKTNMAGTEPPRISLDSIGLAKLGPFWHNILLSGPFWRLYHHDSPGAGVLADGGKIEILPGKFYLLPPFCNLPTWCSGTPFQLYIHFELSMGVSRARFPFLAVEPTDEMKSDLLKLRELLSSADSAKSLNRSFLAISLCARALALLPPRTLRESETDRRLENACDYLRTNLDHDIDLDTLASKARMTPNGFSRLFRVNTGVTPYRYLLQLRYSLAANLLHSGEYSIDEICEMVGVKDRFHFSRTFKKIYGVPPARYRKNYSSGKQA